jgi:hypothetical protein
VIPAPSLAPLPMGRVRGWEAVQSRASAAIPFRVPALQGSQIGNGKSDPILDPVGTVFSHSRLVRGGVTTGSTRSRQPPSRAYNVGSGARLWVCNNNKSDNELGRVWGVGWMETVRL